MDLGKGLIESKKTRQKGGWKGTASSLVLHAGFLGAVFFISTQATQEVVADATPIPVFISQGAAPPPPPPPPPPLAATDAPQTPRVTPKAEIQPVETPRETFVTPREIPREIPDIVQPASNSSANATTEDSGSSSALSAAEGGVAGGVAGGIVGGEVGGVIGGEIGGVIGGVLGGKLGGTLGGTGTGDSGDGTGGNELPAGPVRVGGNVKAPTIVSRVDPEYTEIARKARVDGVVIIEAIIDRNGRVTQVKSIKGLPMGLTDSAMNAVKQWRFKPGTMGGQPVDVIFNLTVNFQLN